MYTVLKQQDNLNRQFDKFNDCSMPSPVKNSEPDTPSVSNSSGGSAGVRSISTAQAARMLGMSTTMLQKLVDQDLFQAWKTPGGHRRIDLNSVIDYQEKLKINPVSKEKIQALPVIKVIVESDADCEKIVKEIKFWGEYFDISFWNSVPDAFLSFSTQIPDILIVQTSSSLSEQVSTVLALDKFLKKSDKPFSVVCLSENRKLKVEIGKGIHDSIQILSSLLNPEWLNVFMSGAYAAVSIASAKNKKIIQ